jgi:hypothetical protein
MSVTLKGRKTMNKIFNFWTSIIILLLIPAGASATRFLSVGGEGILADTIYDDLFITGNKIKMDSYIDGDLFAFCQEIVHSDTIAGNFNSFSANIQVLGPVGESFRGFGYSINCNAPIGRNAMLFGNTITVGPQTRIGNESHIFCYKLIFQGELDGDLHIRADEAEITGHVKGDIDFEDGHLKIGPEAVIDGNIYYKSPQKADISRSAVIYGETNWEEIESDKSQDGGGISFGKIFAWIFSARGYFMLMSGVSIVALVFSAIPWPPILMIIFYSVIFLVSGNVLILLSRDRMLSTIDIIEKRFLPSLGLGFVIFFVCPVVSVVIIFTLVGAPLGITLLLLFGIALFIAIVYASTFLGWKFWEILGKKSDSKTGYLCYSTGIVFLIIISFIPYLGYILITAAIMTGLGGLATSLRPKNL